MAGWAVRSDEYSSYCVEQLGTAGEATGSPSGDQCGILESLRNAETIHLSADLAAEQVVKRVSTAFSIFHALLALTGRGLDRMQARHRFTILTIITTVLLMAWGAFVTSIDAGLAVPDWPSSFNSYDPFNPWPGWWTITPVLAEHGHRLLGALVGLFTLVLSIWTVAADGRRWVRRLSVGALALVVLQGILGGLRVVWVSLDLAVIHACIAQLFFSMLVCMAVFTSARWIDLGTSAPEVRTSSRLVRVTFATSAVIYIQIVLGALLRHPGTGIDLTLASLHIVWAFVVIGLVLTAAYRVQQWFRDVLPLRRWRDAMVGVLSIQFLLGITAFFVLLDETGVTRPSNLQVAANTAHMVVGALLMASSVGLAAWTARYSLRPRPDRTEAPSHTSHST